jgi:hypothetical protein
MNDPTTTFVLVQVRGHENVGDTDRFIRRRMDMDMGMTFNPSKAANRT